jgi:hypothetical protein
VLQLPHAVHELWNSESDPEPPDQQSKRGERSERWTSECVQSCHIDKTLAWSSEHLAAWYGQPKATVPEEKISHLANQALTGDAGQRVLAAWHLSWKPALQASGTNFVQPLLAQLLDDPYAAVRCVAERSIRANGISIPEGYDYTIDPKAREPVREDLWKEWEAAGVTGSSLDTVLLKNGRIDREGFEAILGQRNDRPVRLRE